jgi:L-fucose isomerase-like protein
MNKRNDIPEGSYFVQTYRPNRAGRLILYVAMGDTTKKIQSRFTKLDQDYVYIDGNTISLTPIEKKNSEEIVKDSEIVEESAPIKEKLVEKSVHKKQRGRKSKNE